MPDFTVTFHPQNITVKVPEGTTLLEAAAEAQITINNLCGGDGICGRCRMIVKKGQVQGEVSGKLTMEEIRRGMVLACTSRVTQDIVAEIPEETWAKEKIIADEDAKRFKDLRKEINVFRNYTPSPLVSKIYLELPEPSLVSNTADHQRVCEALKKKVNNASLQMGLKIIKTLPATLRASGYKITATVGLRREVAEVMSIDPGNSADDNYMVIVDMGTTTIVAHLVKHDSFETLDAKACFNSQGVYGREVTGRMMGAEKRGVLEFQRLLVTDINQLIFGLAKEKKIPLKHINAVICAGNTVMGHFLLGLPTENIRRHPFIAATVAPPPLRAAEVGIEINPRGLLYSLPGIGSWVGSDLSAGVLATALHHSEELCLLLDIGTNGEIIVGSKEWLVACSASAGPALEGASVACGMRAESGAIEKVFKLNGSISYSTIGGVPAKGICGSGIIDVIGMLLKEGLIDRGGKFIAGVNPRIRTVDGIRRYVLADKKSAEVKHDVFITETDIENIITAKAAIFAAMKILMERLDLSFSDIAHFYIAGAFGNYLDIENAIALGLIPAMPRERIEFVGNSSIEGAKIAAFYQEAFYEIDEIRDKT
ncbi:MAG: DUF4445 domain-containing protein, partial [Spirochaetales bacterium]